MTSFTRTACAALLVLAAGCSRDFSTVTLEIPAREPSALEKRMVESSNTFGFDLFRRIAGAEPDKNIFISPLSVSAALGMAYNGAASTTADAMRQVLGYQGMTTDEINRTYRSLFGLLTSLDSRVRFEIANSAWYKQGYTLNESFLDALRTWFDAEIRDLDFSDPASIGIINGWVSEKTNGKIDEIIDQIHPLTVLFLINALYFDADWTTRFDADDTFDGEFVRPDGSRRSCRMMQMTAEFPYFENEYFQSISLPYGSEAFTMSVFLPKQGKSVADMLPLFTGENWTAWMGGYLVQETALLFPKFSMEYEIELKDILTAMGMGIAFSGGADFSNISALYDLYISRVKHKTFIEVDEEGTEAAAVTVVEFRETSVGPAIYLTRPFIFVIHDHHTNTLLFMGIQTDPEV
ncbi:serpin family protein [bacterium]|nr:serpin family protein [bacterium]